MKELFWYEVSVCIFVFGAYGVTMFIAPERIPLIKAHEATLALSIAAIPTVGKIGMLCAMAAGFSSMLAVGIFFSYEGFFVAGIIALAIVFLGSILAHELTVKRVLVVVGTEAVSIFCILALLQWIVA